jgi:hypothetical protein
VLFLTQNILKTPPSPRRNPPKQLLKAPPIPQKALTLSRKVDECNPLDLGRCYHLGQQGVEQNHGMEAHSGQDKKAQWRV